MPPDDPGRPPDRVFPTLPIVTPEPPRRSARERYGALFFLGTAGLVVVLALLGWFGWAVWSLRAVWTAVYTLHDDQRAEADRVGAAYALAHDPRVNQRQLWDIALRRTLPPLARYVVAEGLTAEAASADPRGYGVAVARSEGWPDWLRLLLTRPLAYRAALDLPVPRDPLTELTRSPDRSTALWATYALAEGSSGDPKDADTLRRLASEDTPERPLAALLVTALDATRLDARLKALDDATRWLRHHHPEAARLWEGWRVVDGRPVRSP
jgi:hypothetical protein